jgi:hypothetical protein
MRANFVKKNSDAARWQGRHYVPMHASVPIDGVISAFESHIYKKTRKLSSLATKEFFPKNTHLLGLFVKT